MKGRSLAGSAVIIALLCATALAVAPRWHERVHKLDPRHECVVTLVASGQCEQGTVTPISAAPEDLLVSATPLGPPGCYFAAAQVSSILEHAPPACA
jgi:hypothetical protein